MKIIEQLERLQHIHELIEKQQTGTPIEFARKLHIGKRHLFRLLEDLRLLGAPIKYNSLFKTYYYTTKCNVNIEINLEILEEQSLSDITGGYYACLSELPIYLPFIQL